MSEQPPEFLDYRPRDPDRVSRRRARTSAVAKFMLGLLGGGVCSTVLWVIMSYFPAAPGEVFEIALLGIVIAKVAVAGILSGFPKWQPTSAGVLLSLGLGCLIFLGAGIHDLVSPCHF